MNRYHQLTSEERHTLSTLRRQGYHQAAIARALGRHRSTISREVRRNSKDGAGRIYRPDLADDYARWRRSRSRRNQRLSLLEWRIVEAQEWSPEQAAGRLRLEEKISISHETIYHHIWRDQKQGESLYLHPHCFPKQRRKRYGSYDFPRSSRWQT
jgi:IS30 family transposase